MQALELIEDQAEDWVTNPWQGSHEFVPMPRLEPPQPPPCSSLQQGGVAATQGVGYTGAPLSVITTLSESVESEIPNAQREPEELEDENFQVTQLALAPFAWNSRPQPEDV